VPFPGSTHRWLSCAVFAALVVTGLGSAAPLSRWQPLDRNPHGAVGAGVAALCAGDPSVDGEHLTPALDPEASRLSLESRPMLCEPFRLAASQADAGSSRECLPRLARPGECSRE